MALAIHNGPTPYVGILVRYLEVLHVTKRHQAVLVHSPSGNRDSQKVSAREATPGGELFASRLPPSVDARYTHSDYAVVARRAQDRSATDMDRPKETRCGSTEGR